MSGLLTFLDTTNINRFYHLTNLLGSESLDIKLINQGGHALHIRYE